MGKNVSFDYMHKDTVVAHISWDIDTQTVTCEEYQDNLVYQWFGKLDHTVDNLMFIFETRCFDRNRYDSLEILDYLGLPEYSPYHICMKTHGVSTQDYMWIRWKGESLTWDDVKIRDK